MKTLLLFTIVLVSNFALSENACRHFEGVFDCLDDMGDTTPVSFGFSNDTSVIIEGEAVNYGKWTALKDTQDLTQQSARATCEGRNLNVEYKAKDLNLNKKKSSRIEWTSKWNPKDQLELSELLAAESYGRITSPDGSSVDFGNTYVCRRHVPMTLEGKSCPVLEGTFECPKADGTMLDVVISHEDLADSAAYVFSGYRVIANGQKVKIPADYDGPFRDGTIKGWCSQGKMIMEVDAKYYSRNVHTGQMIIKTLRSLDNEKNLVIENLGTIINLNDQHLPLRGKATCRRKAVQQN